MGCPFCPLKEEEILAETEFGWLTHPLIDGTFEPDKRHYLIIPKGHPTELADLPTNWWGMMMDLLSKIPGIEEMHYNVSINCGRLAGQTQEHIHIWIIDRSDVEEPASGKGFRALIDVFNSIWADDGCLKLSPGLAHAGPSTL